MPKDSPLGKLLGSYKKQRAKLKAAGKAEVAKNTKTSKKKKEAK